MKDKQAAEKLSKLTAITIAQLLQRRVSSGTPIVKIKIKQVAIVGDDGETQYKEVERINRKKRKCR